MMTIMRPGGGVLIGTEAPALTLTVELAGPLALAVSVLVWVLPPAPLTAAVKAQL